MTKFYGLHYGRKKTLTEIEEIPCSLRMFSSEQGIKYKVCIGSKRKGSISLDEKMTFPGRANSFGGLMAGSLMGGEGRKINF